jgi:hypothetical protein
METWVKIVNDYLKKMPKKRRQKMLLRYRQSVSMRFRFFYV